MRRKKEAGLGRVSNLADGERTKAPRIGFETVPSGQALTAPRLFTVVSSSSYAYALSDASKSHLDREGAARDGDCRTAVEVLGEKISLSSSPERTKNTQQESTDRRKSLDGKKIPCETAGHRVTKRTVNAFHTRYSSLTTPRETTSPRADKGRSFQSFRPAPTGG